MNKLNLVVFGANGPTGRLLVKQAVAEGHHVTAFTRHPAAYPIRHERLEVIGGNVFDLASVEQAVAGKDAVLSTLGVPYSRKPITVYSEGISHIMQAMKQSNVRRLVCVSSSVTEPNPEPIGGFFFEKIAQPFFVGVMGRTLYDDMRKMETLVKNSELDWVILRPSGLFETPTVTRYQLAEGHINSKFTARIDLADCMLRQATSNQYLRKAVAVGTFAVQPNFLQLLWREGIAKKA